MSSILKISEGATLAIHTMVLMARFNDRLLSTEKMADVMKASSNHLSKVLQRLVHSRLVRSVRGPSGGFQLAKDPGDITLLNVFEAVDGPFTPGACLFQKPLCDGSACVMGGLLNQVNRLFLEHLSKKHLSDLTKAYDCLEAI